MKNIREHSDTVTSSPLESAKQSAADSSNKILYKFEQFCEGFVQDIGEERDIDVSELNNFSMLTAYILRQNINPSCESFNELYNTLKDYANSEYSLAEDYHRDRSYMRLYQLISMTKELFVSMEQRDQAHKLLRSNQFDISLIKAIHENPGCTFTELQSELSIDSEQLFENLTLLIKHHALISCRTGEYQYYLLTYLGNMMFEETHSDLGGI